MVGLSDRSINRVSTMFVWFLLVSMSSLVAMTTAVPLSYTQHNALMEVYSALGTHKFEKNTFNIFNRSFRLLSFLMSTI